jgi:integrase
VPSVQLSERMIAALKPHADKQVDYYDENVKRLVLRVSPGGTKTFYLIYSRPGSSRRRRLKLGNYPDLSLASARSKARENRVAVQEGQDPAREREAAKAQMTVKDLVDTYIMREAVKKRSSYDITRRLNNDVSAVIGDVPLSVLHKRDVTRCIDRVVDRGAPVEASRLFATLRAMLRWAVARGDLDHNVAEGMKPPAEPRVRDRVLSTTEIRTLWTSLPSAAMDEGTRRLIRLCLITGQRVGEIAGMRTDEIDLEGGVWTLPPERTKNSRRHVLPLPTMAIDVIKLQLDDVREREKRLQKPEVPWVFPSPTLDGYFTSAAMARAVARQRSNPDTQANTLILGIEPWTLHDLRRTMATHLEEAGVSPFVIGHLLNHVSVTRASVTSRVYARYDYSSEKKQALDLWAARLAGIIEGNPAQVVPMRPA